MIDPGHFPWITSYVAGFVLLFVIGWLAGPPRNRSEWTPLLFFAVFWYITVPLVLVMILFTLVKAYSSND